MKKKKAAMKFKKSSGEAVAFLEKTAADITADRKKMFGYPCLFINGNMFAGLFADDFFFRVNPAEKEKLMKNHPEYVPFEPLPGRIMKEYLSVRDVIREEGARIRKIIRESLEYASTLPKKKK